MKILFLTFYFKPDLSAGSFRNTALMEALKQKLDPEDTVDVITSMPNRYKSYKAEAENYEKQDNVQIFRINIPSHKSGYLDQMYSFKTFYREAIKLVRGVKYDIVFASSSRLFTAFLGARIARDKKCLLYLDIRDIFTDTIKDVIKNSALKLAIVPVLQNIEQYTISSANHLNLVSKGFEPYFKKYYKGKTSFYTNGIDDEFLDIKIPDKVSSVKPKVITYAGNIGEGQGLDKVIPEAAVKLDGSYKFRIIGDGGAKNKLAARLKSLSVQNVELLNPVNRQELLDMYSQSDFLFLHLNDYEAFRKVLPSKIFEYGAMPLPIIAGVDGYARQFINENIQNAIIFDPANADDFVQKLKAFKPEYKIREEFLIKHKRSNIMKKMAKSILQMKREEKAEPANVIMIRRFKKFKKTYIMQKK